MHLPTIEQGSFRLRPWRSSDAGSLVRHANHPEIARNLRDAFPHPYTPEDAESWLTMVGENRRDLILAIEVEGEASGGIGLHPMQDVYRYNAELGYWLSGSHWGKGIMTGAVGAMVAYAFRNTRWMRIFASIFSHNEASMRVLEKNGFRKEAIHRKSVMKRGVLLDEHYYALLREQWERDRENQGSSSSASSSSSSSRRERSGSGPS